MTTSWEESQVEKLVDALFGEPAPQVEWVMNPRTLTVAFKLPGFQPQPDDYPESWQFLVKKGLAGIMYLEKPDPYEYDDQPPPTHE